jgi:hypothetical protein
MKMTNRLIVGSALGLAAIAIAIDHTKHRLPAPVVQEESEMIEEESPCGMGAEESPCSMDSDYSPCGLGD